MIRVLVSACLLGEQVRWDGGAATASHPILRRWSDAGRLVPFCPELFGGLEVPRPPAEIAGTSVRVLVGKARILTNTGVDVSRQFIVGGRGAATKAEQHGARLAILKDGSPSCGSTWVYDGSFSGAKVAGRGLTTTILEELGVRVFSEQQIEEAAAYLSELEQGSGQPSK